MAGPAILLEIITYIFQRTPPTADCDEPLKRFINLFDSAFRRSDIRSQGLGMIAEMISIVVDRKFMKVTRIS